MWELIELNKRKSLILFAAMGFFLLSLGFFVGQIWFPPDGGFYGIFFALILWSIMALISYSQGSRILLSLSRAQPVSRNLYPQLYNIVEEMKIAANVADMPKIYLIDDPSPNAFACGLNTKNSAVVVTAGLLGHLNRN
ncbi:MAG: M48 family metalloprotease, partial [Candidatus Omnitrophica bacterium]|nr:M48 family metalloprotease [Candidatus Omnitrophota bacterium]